MCTPWISPAAGLRHADYQVALPGPFFEKTGQTLLDRCRTGPDMCPEKLSPDV